MTLFHVEQFRPCRISEMFHVKPLLKRLALASRL